MALDDLQKSIIKTVSHFDVLNYPLTLMEIFEFLEIKTTPAELKAALGSEPVNSLIANQQGWYFLSGREKIIKERQKRYRLYFKKIKRAKNFARIFSVFPWIQAVAIYGSLALKNPSASGDIDMFIITAADRAWSARFFINAFLKFFRLRPTIRTARDKICVSYLADENNLDLSLVNLPDDYYYCYGTGSFHFLLDQNNSVNKFWASNSWLKISLPNHQPTESIRIFRPTRITTAMQGISEKICGCLSEGDYRRLQEKILPQKYWQVNDGKKVALSAGLIKLHDNDKRKKINNLFNENFCRVIKNYGG